MVRGDALEVEGPAAAAPGVLPDRQALALVAMERTRMAMVVVDARQAHQPIVQANAAFLSLTGFDAGEVLGRNCRFLQGPETSREAVAMLRAAVAQEATVNVELLNYRRDGSPFWNEVHLSPVRDLEGRLVYYFGSQWDVSERRSALALRAAEHRLLREIDHRAMNALALVQGFVRLSRRDTVERFAESVQGRVEVLARTHAMLAATRWADVTLEHVLEIEFASRGPGRLTLEGPRVLVSADRVQPLALLTHELATNAATHGALARPEGEVTVSWRGDAHDPRLVHLAFREAGLRRLEPALDGLGLRLVASIVRRQLRGRLRQSWNADGLVTEITCQIAAVEPSDAA